MIRLFSTSRNALASGYVVAPSRWGDQ